MSNDHTQIPVERFMLELLAQDGDKYIFGAETITDPIPEPDPDAFDCSELTQWAAARIGTVPRLPDGSWIQQRHMRRHGTELPVDDAVKIRGAILTKFSSDPYVGGRPKRAHLAVVATPVGDPDYPQGLTIEARGRRWGVGQWPVAGRGWTHAGLVPGLDYEADAEPLPPVIVEPGYVARGQVVWAPTDWMADELAAPAGGTWLLDRAGHVFAVGGAPYYGSPAEDGLTFEARTITAPDSALRRQGVEYILRSSTGERLAYPGGQPL